MTAVRVGEIEDVAADACPEAVPSFVWGDDESVARSSHGVRVALVADWGAVLGGDRVHDTALFRKAGRGYPKTCSAGAARRTASLRPRQRRMMARPSM